MKQKRFKSARQIDAEARMYERSPTVCIRCNQAALWFDYSNGYPICNECKMRTKCYTCGKTGDWGKYGGESICPNCQKLIPGIGKGLKL